MYVSLFGRDFFSGIHIFSWLCNCHNHKTDRSVSSLICVFLAQLFLYLSMLGEPRRNVSNKHIKQFFSNVRGLDYYSICC